MRRYSEIEHLLKLTLAVYRVTAIFPAGEELAPKIRESAYKILCGENTFLYIKEISGLFGLAEQKNLVDSRNFLVLRREYNKIRQAPEICTTSEKTVENPFSKNDQNDHNNHRQEKILEVMNGNGMVKIGELIKLFPGINRRTVLRDLDKLCQVGATVRNGNGRGAHYVKNGHENATMSQ